MIINYYDLPDNLQKGIMALEKEGFLKTGEKGLPIKAVQSDRIVIDKSEQEIVINYDTEPHFYMALARCMGMKNRTQEIEPKVKDFGFMLDCSRNGVAKPDMVKRLISILVLAGYNYLELYTEDTYELPDEPYFGYKRGRYSPEELKEIVAFADIFGFEMIPCIQTLAHMRNLANWGVYAEYMDLEDILLVGDERTYRLIRKSLKFSREVFHTKRINIGTDEAFRLGLGKYAAIHGYRSKHEIYLEHLKKVFEMCREEGFEPEFWADGLYDTECLGEETRKIFDGTQTPIYWNYNISAKENHVAIMEKLKACAGKVMYAGAFWKWVGYAPCNEYSERAMDPAFEAVKQCSIDNVLMTAWGDGGNECSVYAVMSSIWYAAQRLYPCETDVNEVVRLLTGYTSDEWRSCDKVDYLRPNTGKLRCTATKDLLFNDFLIGIMDYHVPEDAKERYWKLSDEFHTLAERNSPFSYIFESYAALCHALIHKSTYSKRLYQAYQRKDHETIRTMICELQDIRQNIREFYDKFRRLWMTENKGFGFEVSDVRIGGLISRMDTVAIVLNDYLEGHAEKIYELEEERIPFWCKAPEGDERFAVWHGDWPYNYTVNYLMQHYY